MSEKLLPCPFCGEQVAVRFSDDCIACWSAVCPGCDCEVGAEPTRKDAVEWWNRRAKPKTPAIDEILAGLEKALDKGSGFYVVADGPGEHAAFSEELIMAAVAEHRGQG